jgi:hypothetical protein
MDRQDLIPWPLAGLVARLSLGEGWTVFENNTCRYATQMDISAFNISALLCEL